MWKGLEKNKNERKQLERGKKKISENERKLAE